jgi:formylglycine-generating enzyme required for sulfatase activity
MANTANSSAQEDLYLLPEDILELAALLAPAVHIDPSFLRNFRSSALPSTDTGLEARFWHSELVASRSSSVITLDWEQVEGLGRAACKASPERFQRSWEIIDALHRYLPGNLRLQEALRYAAITETPIDELVARIHHTLSDLTDVEQRRSLGRWLKTTLPELPSAYQDSHFVQWLAAVARAELGDSPAQFYPQEYERSTDIPDWLFPQREIQPKQTIGLQLTPGVLSIVEPSRNAALLQLETAIPTLLRVTWDTEGGKTGGWIQTGPDNQLAIDEKCRGVEIFVPDGRRFRLWAERQEGLQDFERQYVLLHLAEDRELAEVLRGLLQDRSIGIELREEQPTQTGRDFSDRPVICLWTRSAASYWQDLSTEKTISPPGVLLRTDSTVSLPQGAGAADAIDLLDLKDPESLESAIGRLLDIEADDQKRKGADQKDDHQEKVEPDRRYSDEVSQLLDETDNPETKPPRRLEIGDRLAELGDPRPGVGVREIEVPDDSTVAEETKKSEEAEFAEAAFPPEVQRLLDELNDIKTEPPRRLAIGDELDRLGDPRKGVGLDEKGLPEIDWVEIPGGPSIYQDGETLDLPTFFISRYPVTNAQFQAFIDAGGYGKRGVISKRISKLFQQTNEREEDWWADLKQPKPDKPTWPQGNRPRTEVDWYESVAFTRWLTVTLGYEVRLPTDQEWEKAARGTEGLIYPWGKEYQSGYANLDEKASKAGPWYLKQTTAVGMYPHGRSPQGLEDMAGNVWEWCLNKYDHPEIITPDSSGDRRVLRGGSWVYDAGLARADYRRRGSPGARDDYGGFRLLSSVPIADR